MFFFEYSLPITVELQRQPLMYGEPTVDQSPATFSLHISHQSRSPALILCKVYSLLYSMLSTVCQHFGAHSLILFLCHTLWLYVLILGKGVSYNCVLLPLKMVSILPSISRSLLLSFLSYHIDRRAITVSSVEVASLSPTIAQRSTSSSKSIICYKFINCLQVY